MHVILPAESVEKVVDELHISLSDASCTERICEDATLKVNKLISTAEMLQRIEKGNKLLTRHIKQASDLLGMDYNIPDTSQHLNKLETPEEEEPLFYRETTEVDLYDLTHGATSECVSAPLALEVNMTSEHCKTTETLPPSLYRYLTLLCQQVVSRDGEQREEALEELRTSSRVSLVLPYLIQFIEQKLRENMLLADNTILLLSCYKHILQNNNIFLEPYIPNLLDICYSMCCDWTEHRETANNPTVIIEHSSDVAAVAILNYHTPKRKYYGKYTKFCTETIESDEMSYSALGSLTLLSKLGPVSINDNILPLIFGIYKDIFTKPITSIDQTILHIQRVLKLALHSHFNVIYKALHESRMTTLIEEFDRCHAPYPSMTETSGPATTKGPSPFPLEPTTPLLTYDQVYETLGACMSMVTTTWPDGEHPSPLLTKKMTKELSKKLTETFSMFGTMKGKMLPAERRVFLRKQTDKQIKANQIYTLHNNFAPLRYFL